MLRRSRVACRCDRKELMLWGNTSVRLPVALHLILQAVSPCTQRTHNCVNAWCSSRLEKTAVELDQITGSELMCCHGTTPCFFAKAANPTAHTVAALGRPRAPACRIPKGLQNDRSVRHALVGDQSHGAPDRSLVMRRWLYLVSRLCRELGTIVPSRRCMRLL
jgi:hypothetical protein